LGLALLAIDIDGLFGPEKMTAILGPGEFGLAHLSKNGKLMPDPALQRRLSWSYVHTYMYLNM
jgi:hypothetical protein